MAENKPSPPIAKIVPHSFEHLGHAFMDHYFWLQNKTDPEVIDYLNAENAYAKDMLSHTKPLQEQLFKEMRGRIMENDSSAPESRGGYFYYTREEAGKQYRFFCRKAGSLSAPEEILLDENILAEGKAYCRVYVYQPSPDHSLLAYSVDTTGSWVFDLYIKDLRTGEVIAGPISDTAWSAAWANDNRTLFYTEFDASHRPYKLHRLLLGKEKIASPVYYETDESFNLIVKRSRSGKFIFLTVASQSTSEVLYLSAETPHEPFKLIQPRQHWLEYYAEHHGEHFLIFANDQAENFKLVSGPVASPGKENWREIIPHRTTVLIEEVYAFRGHLVIFERQDGLAQIRISAPDGISNKFYVDFPEPVYAIQPLENPEYESSKLRFFYSSMVTPESTIDYDMNTRTWEVIKRKEIPSGYDPDLYITERLHARSHDGIQVPISLAYRKGLKRDGSNPLVLYGYGSYGSSSEASFDAKRLSLLDRGFVYAIAHIRGGSELGRKWYEDGRLMNKMNSFYDFIACAEHLVDKDYTSPEKLGILGRSAGGLLVSAVTNMRPELFKAVVALVPFTNVITAMLTPDLPLTVIEYEQWGHPNTSDAFNYMLSYSPYENIEAKTYPHIYAEAGLNDLQVPYWDPAKWVAKLRALKKDNNLLVFVTNMEAGHGGYSGRYDYLREYAQYYAFLIDKLL